MKNFYLFIGVDENLKDSATTRSLQLIINRSSQSILIQVFPIQHYTTSSSLSKMPDILYIKLTPSLVMSNEI